MTMNFPDLPTESPAPKIEVFNTSGIELPFDSSVIPTIVRKIELGENVRYQNLEIVFVDEKEIVEINEEHLDRDYITDIITFRYDEDTSNQQIEGTLYCCAPRIKEQGKEFAKSEREEFLRVVIHGFIHLIGYDDSTDDQKAIMTNLEDKYLGKLP